MTNLHYIHISESISLLFSSLICEVIYGHMDIIAIIKLTRDPCHIAPSFLTGNFLKLEHEGTDCRIHCLKMHVFLVLTNFIETIEK